MWVEDEGSLLNRTFVRLKGLGVDDVISVTNEKYRFATERTASEFQFNHHMILEPFGKNTAGAIGIACKYIKHHFGGDAIALVLPSDHIIQDKQAFFSAVQSAVTLAQQKNLVTLGVTPTSAHTGYGYIKAGNVLGVGNCVDAFVEKPNANTAQSYLDDGGYYWNAGMFVFTADEYIQSLKDNATDILSVVNTINVSDKGFIIDGNDFKKMPDISIDYAVMERAKNVAVVPVSFDWNDLGSWDSVAKTLSMDENGNRARESSDVLMMDSRNTTVFSTSDDKLVATVGLDDITVVETRDAVLVAKTDKLQGVKDLVSHLKAKNHEAVEVHRTEHRPWGTFTILDEGENYKVKQIMVLPYQKLSLQSHKYRSEHWVVVAGQAIVENDSDVVTLEANQSTYIPQGHKHRLSNNTDSPVIIIETQTGTYLGEDDIERFEDIYKRV